MGVMPAVLGSHGQEGVTRPKAGEVDRHVGLRPGRRLHIRVLRSEDLTRTVNGELLKLINILASGRCAPARITVRQLVRGRTRHHAYGTEPGEVLRRHQFNPVSLALYLLLQAARDLLIDVLDRSRRPQT